MPMLTPKTAMLRLAIRVSRDKANHHLWNNNGTWWFHFTVRSDQGVSKRIRHSLKTTDIEKARSSRDRILNALTRVAGDELRDALAWSGEAEERFFRADAPSSQTDRRDLDEFVGFGIEPGCLKVVDHERIPGMEAIGPDERMIATGACEPAAHQRPGAAQMLATGCVRTGDLHDGESAGCQPRLGPEA